MSAPGRRLTPWFADAVCRKEFLAALALLVVVALAGCSTRPVAPPSASVGTTPGPSLTAAPTPAASPALTPTSLPKASPVAEVAGSETLASEHWVGYTFPVSGVTGVRAQWLEPTVGGPSGAEEFVWVGIGGWAESEQNIIQIGTFVYFRDGDQENEGIWYQIVPVQHPRYPLINVIPGDKIVASVVQRKRPQKNWRVSLTDVSSGQSFSKTVRFGSLGAYPSLVVEDPDRGPLGPSGPFYIFPRWGTVTFSNMEIRIGGHWKPAASIYGYRIQMLRNGRTLAIASPLDKRSGFTAKQK